MPKTGDTKTGKHRVGIDFDIEEYRQLRIAVVMENTNIAAFIRAALHDRMGIYKVVRVDEADIEADSDAHQEPPASPCGQTPTAPKRRGRPPRQPAKPQPPVEPVPMISEPSYTMGDPGLDGWSGDMEVPDDDPEELDFNDNESW